MEQAEDHARGHLDLLMSFTQASNDTLLPFNGNDVCMRSWPALLLNLGILAEVCDITLSSKIIIHDDHLLLKMQNKGQSAREMYAEASKVAEGSGLREYMEQARSELQRLGDDGLSEDIIDLNRGDSSTEINDF